LLLLMGSWLREERRYNGCGIQQQPLGFGLQLGSPPHDAVSIRAKPKRPRDAAHFFSRCALLFCQSAEISLRHEANNSAEGLKVPTVCNALSCTNKRPRSASWIGIVGLM
jgi:hypothetical protein